MSVRDGMLETLPNGWFKYEYEDGDIDWFTTSGTIITEERYLQKKRELILSKL